MRKKPLKRKTGLKRTPIRKVSAKLSTELRRYYVLRDDFLNKNRFCGIGVICNRLRAATEIHHKARRGKNLNKVETWVQTCRDCHQFVETHGKWSRENGWLT